MEKRKNYYIAKSLQMANHLCMHGFPILKVEDSYYDKGRFVFFFDLTKEVEDLATEYINQSRATRR